MHILLLSDETPRTPHIVRHLEANGYLPEVLGAIRFTGDKPTSKQLRRAVLKAILRSDAVCVLSDAPDAGQLARLAVICQWLGIPLMNLEDLPRYAPADPAGFDGHAFHVPLDIDASPPELSPSQRLLRTVRTAWQRHAGSAYARR